MFVPFNVRDFLDRAEIAYSYRLGVLEEPGRLASGWGPITFSELARRARAQAAGLDAAGVNRGDRVAVVSRNSSRLLTAMFGVCGWGRTLVPVNPALAAADVRSIVEDARVAMLLIDADLDERLSDIPCARRHVVGPGADEVLYPFHRDPEPWDGDEEATASMTYTIGLSGLPIGAQLSHRSCWINAAMLGWHVGVSDQDTYLHTLPMWHVTALGMAWATVGMGCTQVILSGGGGAEILRTIDERSVTLLCGDPDLADTVLDAAAGWPGPVPGRGRVRMVVAGADLPAATIERLETELGWELIHLYGRSETSPLLTTNRRRAEWDDLSPSERARKLAAAGAPALGARVAVDATGEVLARGNGVMEGYWRQPAATEAALAGGWLHTGDRGEFDDDRYLHVRDPTGVRSSHPGDGYGDRGRVP